MVFDVLIRPLLRSLFGPPDAKKTAQGLAQYSMRRGFREFRNTQFRVAAQFEQLEVAEHDRIFNELIVSNVVLELLMLDTFANLTRSGVKEFLRSVHDVLPEKFLGIFRAVGEVEEKNIQLWGKLITLRQDEYEQQRLESRHALPEFGEGNPWSRVVAIGCLFHIRRGKNVVSDPLIPRLMSQAVDVSMRTMRAIEWSTRRL